MVTKPANIPLANISEAMRKVLYDKFNRDLNAQYGDKIRQIESLQAG
jgi:hypothetical protein